MKLENLKLKILRNRNYKKLRLSFKGVDSLLLSAPKYASKKECLDFLESSKEWIQENLKRRTSYNLRDFLREDKIYLFGEWVDFDCEVLKKVWSDFVLYEKKMNLAVFYKQELQNYLAQKVPYFARQMNLFPKSYKIGNAFNTLGKCSSKEILNFSTQLIFMPKDAIDSVIIHELAHLKFMNHSQNFWNLVRSFDKNPSFVKLWLKENYNFHKALFYEIFKN